MAGVQELSAILPPSTLPTTFPSPVLHHCTDATPMPAQETVLPLASPASLNALAEHFFDEYERRTHTPTLPTAPFLLGSGYATTGGCPDLRMESYLHPGVALESTALFDWTTLASPNLPPQPSHRWSQIMMAK